MSGIKDKHNKSHTRTYKSWEMMVQRCTNPNFDSYKFYGALGISFCEEWTNFKNFYKDMGDRPEGMSLDRINNKLGYFKENCRWATNSTQSFNKGLKSNNTSGTVGVYWHKNSDKWMASIGVDKKSKYLGLFEEEADAIAARKSAEKLYYKEKVECQK